MTKTKNIILLLGLIGLLCNCERDDRFYRPRMPHILSAVVIIDADDTSRYIMFEKTFQVEYRKELTDSLRDLSFTISDSRGEIHSFHSDRSLENQFYYRIPDSIEFISGEKYFFRAKERDCPEISSSTIVPNPPPELTSTYIRIEELPDYIFLECPDRQLRSYLFSYVYGISYENDLSENLFFSLIMEFHGYHYDFGDSVLTNYLDFDVRETNAHGFIAQFPGLKSIYRNICDDERPIIKKPVHSFFTEGRNISKDHATFILATHFNYFYRIPLGIKTFRIKLLSIPEDMYQFQKNLYTYTRNLDDPFSEPVYLKGNIEGGHGIFAICRSSALFVTAIHGYH